MAGHVAFYSPVVCSGGGGGGGKEILRVVGGRGKGTRSPPSTTSARRRNPFFSGLGTLSIPTSRVAMQPLPTLYPAPTARRSAPSSRSSIPPYPVISSPSLRLLPRNIPITLALFQWPYEPRICICSIPAPVIFLFHLFSSSKVKSDAVSDGIRQNKG